MSRSEYFHLFNPIKIGTLTIKNRFVMPPMLSDLDMGDHYMTDRAVSYYERRAKGGFGLLITEYLCVDKSGLGCPQQIGIWSDDFLPGLKKLTYAVHHNDAKIFAQLHHQGVLAAVDDIQQTPVGPSPICSPSAVQKVRALSKKEIVQLVEKFAQAARRAKSAGFDGVEVHAAHGYLIGQFLSPFFNKRQDEFGGSYQGRFRFCEEILKRIKELCGSEYPISVRISSDEFLESGITPHDFTIYAMLIEQAGADCIHVSTGGAGGNVVTPYFMRPGFNIDNIRRVKESVSIPVIGVGRINEPALADTFIKQGHLDLVSLGRESLSDPDFPNKAQSGREKEIIPCVACLQRCFFTPGYDEQDIGISCMLNPFTGKENLWKLETAKKRKKIAVVGAGPGGLETSWISAARGHQVDLFEKEDLPGGAFKLASVPPYKQDFAKVIDTYVNLCKRYGVRMHFGVSADIELLTKGEWDEIIVATGAVPIIPPIPGLDTEKHLFAQDILAGKRQMSGRKVLIIGGGLVGCETAEYLSVYKNDITVIEMKEKAAVDASPITRAFLLKSMKNHNIRICTSAEVKEIRDFHVKISERGEEKTEIFEEIVVAAGSRAYDNLSGKMQEAGINVSVIGDAKQARDARSAIYEAVLTAIKL